MDLPEPVTCLPYKMHIKKLLAISDGHCEKEVVNT